MQEHEHLDFDGWRRLVEALLRGKVRRWLNALGCPVCRRRIRQLIGLQSPQPERSPGSWDEIRDRFRRELARASEDSRRAERVVGRFLEASELQRDFWLKNSKLRGNLALCQKVIQLADREVRDSPVKAQQLASLALELADWVDDAPSHRARLWEDCRAEAWLVRGRVHGRFGEMREAQGALRNSRQHHGSGSSDPLTLGKLLRVESSILGQRGLFEVATRRLEQAITVHQSIDDREGETWCRLGFAYLEFKAERPMQAIWHLRKTRQFLGKGVEVRHELFLRHNELANLCFLHEFDQAARLAESSRDLYERFQQSEVRVRLPWVLGKISAGSLRFNEARSHYEQCRRLLLETWGDLEAALLALEYGQLYVELDRPRKATRLLEQALPVLRARSLPDVPKAEELLAEAARRDRGPHTPTD